MKIIANYTVGCWIISVDGELYPYYVAAPLPNGRWKLLVKDIGAYTFVSKYETRDECIEDARCKLVKLFNESDCTI